MKNLNAIIGSLITIWFTLAAASLLFGCGDSGTRDLFVTEYSYIEGVVKDVSFAHEDELHAKVIIEFDDGVINLLRLRFQKRFEIQKGKKYKISFDCHNEIQKIEITDDGFLPIAVD